MKRIATILLSMLMIVFSSASAFAMPKSTLDAAIAQANTELEAEYKLMIKKEVLNRMYPVGSIYIAYANVSAATVGNTLGGTWTQITGRFLYGTTGNVGETGGELNTNIDVYKMPSHSHGADAHTHSLGGSQDCRSQAGTNKARYVGAGSTRNANTANPTVGYAGTQANVSHSTCPPYIHVSVFRRTS